MNKILGSILILAGTALGAGMLALPIVAAKTGFFWATLLIVVVWALMTYTGLLILEVNLVFPAYRNNFGTMAAKTVGPVGKVIAWISCLALLYSLTTAYIAGDASLLAVELNKLTPFVMPEWSCALLFTVVLGGAVFWSTRTVDNLNRGLFSVKGILLVVTLVLLLPHININVLSRGKDAHSFLLICLPVFVCAFGFHTVIPSISNYIGPKPKRLKWVVIIGATVPLLIYILWLLATLAVIPLLGAQSFHTLAAKRGSVGMFVNILTTLVHDKWVTTCINGFSNVAMTTSFLGVTLGLFDFLADLFKILNSRIGRLQTALLTFVPPLVFAIVYPKGFVVALGYAAVFVAVLEIILPVLMVRSLRKNRELHSPYRVRGGAPIFVLVLLSGVAVIVIEFINSLHLL